MKRFFAGGAVALLLVLSGCVNFNYPPFQPGATEDEIVAGVGKPTARYKDGDTILLEYARGYWGQYTHMGRLGPDGRLVSWEQVLTNEKFDELVIGKSTKQDVLLIVGQPGEYTEIALNNYEVWTYHYKQEGVWDSVMHLMFDRNGILRKMETGLDLMYSNGE
ncbi:hypothetical protein LJC19_04200 [Oxalobacter sp. OttesenSCG-928-P03]|nr:hypothetical protein [Oxalobacter sp. OttesenSCG-928-P03]